MVLRNSAERQSVLEDKFDRRLFTRRTDLTNEIRLAIATSALHAKMNGVWGTITDLANRYEISRPFVYSLADDLKKVGQFLFREAAEFVYAPSHRELGHSDNVVASTGGAQQYWCDIDSHESIRTRSVLYGIH